MNLLFIFLWMLFNHILDDYFLQGILASMKQKSWWQKQEGYNDKYKYDYIPALICHSISWTFMIMFPLAYYINFNITYNFFVVFVLNAFIHAYVDNSKANWKSINLVQDQFIHFLQILWTLWLFVDAIIK